MMVLLKATVRPLESVSLQNAAWRAKGPCQAQRQQRRQWRQRRQQHMPP